MDKSIQDVVLCRYIENLKFFRAYDIDLYNRIETISEALRINKLPQRFDLKYIDDQKEFDIYDNITKTYILNRKPKLWKENMVNSVNMNTDNIFSLLNFHFYDRSNETTNITDLDYMELMQLKLKIAIKNFTSIYQDSIYNRKEKKELISSEKFIFVGVLHGIHIIDTIKKSKAKYFLVCEDNLEIFRLSLFLCDYKEFLQNNKTVVFSVMDNDSNFTQKYDLFYGNNYHENLVFRYSSTYINVENYFTKINGKLVQKNPLSFSFIRYFKELIEPTIKNYNLYKKINFGKIRNKIFENDNILFLAPGPSLGKNIKWVQENQNRFIIVSLSASVNYLLNNGVDVDVLVTLDAQKDIVVNQFKNIEKSKLDNIIKIASLNTSDEVFKYLDNDNLYTYESLGTYQENNLTIDGGTVGEVTFKLLLLFNVQNIYILGIDLSLNQITNETHISEYRSKIIDQNIIYVDGNIKDKVKTTHRFYQSLFDYTNAIKDFKKDDQRLYNLSDDGAFISNTIPLDIKNFNPNFKFIDKNRFRESITTNLNNISILKLSQKEKNIIEAEIKFIENTIKFIIKVEKQKVKEFLILKRKFEKVFDSIEESNYLFLKLYFRRYYETINRYIYFVLNDKKNGKNIILINQFKEKWSFYTIELLKEYLKQLKLL